MLKNKSSLYRIYRPTLFQDVAGHNNVVEILQKELNDNAFGHAFLFSGQKGTGKTSVARIFAKAVNCENLQGGEPCEKCDHCLLANAGQAPDIYEIDAASNNGVDEIRNIKNNVVTMPIKGKYKIYIIDEVHMLSKGAFNALLKTLEEPPTHALFILATTEFAKIPQTIISRCQTFTFKKIDRQSLIDRLNFVAKNEGFNLESDVAEEIFFLADGSLRDALNVLEQLMIISDEIIVLSNLKKIFYVATKKEKIKVITDILAHNTTDLINYFENAENQGLDFDVFVLSLIELIKEIIEFRLTQDSGLLKVLTSEEINHLNGDLKQYFFLADQLCDTYAKTKGTNVNFNYLLINILKATVQPNLQTLNQSNTQVEKPLKSDLTIDLSFKKDGEPTNTVSFAKETTKIILPSLDEMTLINEEKTNVPLVTEQVDFAVEPAQNLPIQNTLTLLEAKLKLVSKYGEKKYLKIENSAVINLLVGAAKEKRDLVNQQVDIWFKTDVNDHLLHPQSATEFIAFYGAKIAAASDCEILVRFETEAGANFLKKELMQSHYQNRLKKQLAAEYVFYPVDNDQWEMIKKEYLFKKKSKTLPAHTHQLDSFAFYQKAIIREQKDDVTQDFLQAANDLFGEDVEIGD